MLKSFLLASVLTVLSTASFAQTTLEKADSKQIRLNYSRCAAADSSWMQRFGNYIAGYDLGETYDICRKKAWPQTNSTARRMGCHIDGQFVVAGYYCDKN